jgi:hypothetical protein
VTVGGDGEAQAEAFSVALALLDAVGGRFGLSLGFQHGKRDLAETQQMIENQLLTRIIHRAAGNIHSAWAKA